MSEKSMPPDRRTFLQGVALGAAACAVGDLAAEASPMAPSAVTKLPRIGLEAARYRACGRQRVCGRRERQSGRSAQFDAPAARQGGGGSLVDAVRARLPAHALLPEQEFHEHRGRAGRVRGAVQRGGHRRLLLPRRAARCGQRQPGGDARAASAHHEHRPRQGRDGRHDLAAGRRLGARVSRAARRARARFQVRVQQRGHLHAVRHRAEAVGQDRAGLSHAAPVCAAWHREPDVGNLPERHQHGRMGPERQDRGHRAFWADGSAKGAVERQAGRARRLGGAGHVEAGVRTATPPRRAIGVRGTAISSGAVGTTRFAGMARSVNTVLSCRSRTLYLPSRAA